MLSASLHAAVRRKTPKPPSRVPLQWKMCGEEVGKIREHGGDMEKNMKPRSWHTVEKGGTGDSVVEWTRQI